MRAKGECGDTKLERRREQLKKIDETIQRGAKILHEGDRVITRIPLSAGDIKKASALRRRVHEIDVKTSAPRKKNAHIRSGGFRGPN